ncbi:MAG: hypothetical protein H6836_00970 [Planctomycetes bacterium]|nr:hypothetical protein [Planctomycetota bacterium]
MKSTPCLLLTCCLGATLTAQTSRPTTPAEPRPLHLQVLPTWVGELEVETMESAPPQFALQLTPSGLAPLGRVRLQELKAADADGRIQSTISVSTFVSGMRPEPRRARLALGSCKTGRYLLEVRMGDEPPNQRRSTSTVLLEASAPQAGSSWATRLRRAAPAIEGLYLERDPAKPRVVAELAAHWRGQAITVDSVAKPDAAHRIRVALTSRPAPGEHGTVSVSFDPGINAAGDYTVELWLRSAPDGKLEPIDAFGLHAQADAPAIERASGTPEALALATAVARRGGHTGWRQVDNLVFTFAGGRRLYWDRRAGKVRVEVLDGRGRGQITVYDTAARKNTLVHPASRGVARSAEGVWINDTYWLLAPLKVLDAGVRLAVEAPREGDDKHTARLRLRFHGVGLTPQNQYVLHVDRRDGQVLRWDYFPTVDTASPRSWAFAGYCRVGPLWLSLSRPAVGRGRAIELTDVAVNVTAPADVWTRREPMLGAVGTPGANPRK